MTFKPFQFQDFTQLHLSGVLSINLGRCAVDAYVEKFKSIYIYLIQKFDLYKHISHYYVKQTVTLIFSTSNSMHVITPLLDNFPNSNILVFTYYVLLIFTLISLPHVLERNITCYLCRPFYGSNIFVYKPF